MSNIEEQIKSTELFMIAQFIDVMEVLEKYGKIEDLKQDLSNRKRIYLETIKKMTVSEDFLSLNLYNKDIDAKIEKCRAIYSSSIDNKEIVYLSYKIGLIDGMKLKNKCICKCIIL